MKNKGSIVIATTFFVAVIALFLYWEIALPNRVSLWVTVSIDGNEEQINCWENGQEEYAFFLPSGISMEQVYLKTDTITPVMIGGSQVQNGMPCDGWLPDVTYPLTYTYFGKTRQGSITFINTSTVSMYIDTESGSLDQIHGTQKHREDGTLRIYNVDGTNVYEGALDSIGGRGNSTWDGYEKKPYNIKLLAEADLLGMGSAQKWVLLANAADITHIRNRFVLDYAAEIGLDFTPQKQWVDLYINGTYRGLYLLCERIEIHPQRVDISDEKGVLVCMDRESKLMGESDPYVKTSNSQSFGISDTMVDSESVQKLLQSVENALISEDGIDSATGKNWKELIDMDSWARKYLIEELFGNMDAGCQSQYYYCDMSDENPKLYAGPAWDYDLSMGTIWMMRNPQTLFADRLQVRSKIYTPWIYSLCRKAEFAEYVAEIYEAEFVPLMEHYLTETVPGYLTQIADSLLADWKCWGISEQDALEETQMVQNYLEERLDFLQHYFLGDKDYCAVQVDAGTGVYMVYQFVEQGATLSDLKLIVDNSTGTFEGWYYTKSGLPIDVEQPIYEDLAIIAKWGTPLWLRMIESVLLLGICVFVLTGFFFGLLWIDKRRGRKSL